MIFQKFGFIYLHIPKTGGNSIQTLLQPFSDDRIVLRGHQDGKDRFEIEGDVTRKKHAFLSDYASDLGQDLEHFQVLMSVRHPVDRAISFYFSPHRWLKRSGEASEWQLETPHWSLDAFEDCLKQIVPMVEFVRVNGNLINPDHIIRFENLVGDFQKCTELLGLNVKELPHVNRSTSTKMAADAANDPAVKRLVAHTFAKDFEFFGYQ